MQNPRQYKIPDWFLNRQKDVKDGKYSQVSGQQYYKSFWTQWDTIAWNVVKFFKMFPQLITDHFYVHL